MFSKIFFSALVALLVAQTMAYRDLCPAQDVVDVHVYQQYVTEDAPEFGRIEKEVFFPFNDKTITCITMIGVGGSTVSITSVGFTDEGVNMKLVSGIRQGLNAQIDFYSNE